MANDRKLCMCCMSVVPTGVKACPKCGYNGTQKNPENCLPIGYRLGGRYVVGKALDSDGECVSYVSYDCTANAVVELREFLPKNGCKRDTTNNFVIPKQGAELHYKTALSDFCELYRNLHKLSHEISIIRTLDFFEANQTAYAVLERFAGVSLKEFLALSGGTLEFDKCMTLLSPVLDALESIHSVNLIHRGVSPDTIFISRNGVVKLGGFATSSVRTKDTEVVPRMFPGYSAPEQYSTTAWQNTQTDVYGIAAVFYRALTGVVPQSAEQRVSYDTLEAPIALVSAVPHYASRAIMNAMNVNIKERVRNAEDFRHLLNNEPLSDTIELRSDEVVEKSSANRPTRPAGTKKERAASSGGKNRQNDSDRGSGALKTILIVLATIIVVCGGLYVTVGKKLIEELSVKPSDTPVSTLTVPDYVGKQVSSIVFDNDNFFYAYEYVTEDGYDDNYIIRQQPESGSAANGGETITLFVNKSAKIEMIDVVGYSQANAEAKLEEAGIKFKIEKETTDKFAEGIVIRQEIQKGVSFDPDRTVRIIVATAAPSASTTTADSTTPTT